MVRLRKEIAGIEGPGDFDSDLTPAPVEESAEFVAACLQAAQSIPVTGVERDEMPPRGRDLRAKMRQARADIKRRDAQVAALAAELELQRSAVAEATTRVDHLAAVLHEVNTDRRDRDAMNVDLAETMFAMHVGVRESTLRADELSAEVEEWRSAVVAADARAEKRAAKLNQARKDLRERDGALEDLTAELAAARRRIRDLVEAKEKASTRLALLEQEMEARDVQHERTLAKVREVSDERADESAAAQAALHARDREVADLQQQLLELVFRRAAEANDLLSVLGPPDDSSSAD
ncbi:MAG: hypothetical protein ACJ71Z_11800 [Aeromicrobium sp.]